MFPVIHGVVSQAAAPPAPSDALADFHADMAAQNPITVVAYGDSWTYGVSTAQLPWATKLGAHIRADNPNAAFVNEGMGGWDSSQGLANLANVTAHAPDYCILNFGINDWGHTRGSNSRTVAQYTAAMTAMVDALEAAGCKTILWVSGPVRSTSGSDYGCGSAVNDSSYEHKFIDYVTALKSVGASKGAPVIDVRQAFIDHHDNVASICPWFWNDIHFDQLGHDFMYAQLRGGLLPGDETRIVSADSFTAPDGTLLTAHTLDLDIIGSGWQTAWSSPAGEIQGNRFVASMEIAAYVVDAGAAGMTARVRPASIDGQGIPSAIVRHNGAPNVHNCWVVAYTETTGMFTISERNAGVVTTRASQAGAFPTVLEARAYADRVECWADGAKIMEFASQALNANTCGGFGNFTSMGSAAFDEFSLFTIDNEAVEPTVLVRDVFLDVDGTRLGAHAPDIDTVGGGWSEHDGTWEISNNAARKTAASAAHQTTSIDAGQSDGIVSITVSRTGNGETSRAGLAFRVVDNDNFWGVWVNGTNLQMFKREGGTFTQVGATVSITNAQDTWRLTATLNGNSISVLCELEGGGSHTLTATDDAHATATRHGLWAFGTTHLFEEFLVQVL